MWQKTYFVKCRVRSNCLFVQLNKKYFEDIIASQLKKLSTKKFLANKKEQLHLASLKKQKGNRLLKEPELELKP